MRKVKLNEDHAMLPNQADDWVLSQLKVNNELEFAKYSHRADAQSG